MKRIVRAPRVLNLATHGYFGDDTDDSPDEIPENPLLRSGLALAGANRLTRSVGAVDAKGEDGVLTAFEVSGLNLFGTELVVLSACETGVGKGRTGEGVYGMPRGFQQAGAESIIMSLWKVPDKETSELLRNFYMNWLGGQSKQEALRHAALKILNDCRDTYGTANPLLWGGFILTGNPG